MISRRGVLVSSLVLSLCALGDLSADARSTTSLGTKACFGGVMNARTGKPVSGATVTLGDTVSQTGEYGDFRVAGGGSDLGVRAPGFERKTVPLPTAGAGLRVSLEPFAAKALYLSVYGIGCKSIRESAFQVIKDTRLNALVVDLKGDRGLIPYPSKLPLAAGNGALRVRTIPDLGAFVASLKARGLYTIARIVVFKDDILAETHQAWAIKTRSGALWKDRQGLAWIDPTRTAAWSYSIGIAREAAAAGFDEIQFDYVRFPDRAGLVYSRPLDEAARVREIDGFLKTARSRLKPYNVFLSVDVFGYVCWNRDDTRIGQRLEDLAKVADYISPMLYPSSFQYGIPGCREPVDHPYEIVRRSLERAVARTAGLHARYRPWLQAFRDYAFGRQVFDGARIASQVRAAESVEGVDGWMLWNPRNAYTDAGLKPQRNSPAQ